MDNKVEFLGFQAFRHSRDILQQNFPLDDRLVFDVIQGFISDQENPVLIESELVFLRYRAAKHNLFAPVSIQLGDQSFSFL